MPTHVGPDDVSSDNQRFQRAAQDHERVPLLMKVSSAVSFADDCRSPDEWEQAIRMASIFLTDFERGRPPTLPPIMEVSRNTLIIHNWRYSTVWTASKAFAVCALFLASCLEGGDTLVLPFSLNGFAIAVFSGDLILQTKLKVANGSWTLPTLIMLAALSTEMLLVISYPNIRGRFMLSSIAKPIILFNYSRKARHALEAVSRIANIVLRVIALELLLILSFAAVACRLFDKFKSFRNLATAWVSLFQLSTTVVNPSMWMPMYSESKTAAFFFIPFVITMTLYVHSLVLSVVFQAYIQESTAIYERSLSYRDETVWLAYQCLQEPERADSATRMVRTAKIRKTLHLLRPHYSSLKVDALISIIDPSNANAIEFNSFRIKIQQALSASVRSALSLPNLFSQIVEFSHVFVGVSNFIYVILLTSVRPSHWFDAIMLPAGFIITMLGVLELATRMNLCMAFRSTSTTKHNFIFDGMAALAAIVSCCGIIRRHIVVELMLTGRAIDMIRIMRFHRIFREVIDRSGEVLPALIGPIALVLSTHHIFVYIGMSLWGGRIHVGAYGDAISPFYDLNNFNSYWEGLVTVFQILIVNDWHAIAGVYLHADRYQHPFFVYSFFVAANLVCVSITLNCLLAFFVGAFVAKIGGQTVDNRAPVMFTRQKKLTSSTRTSGRLHGFLLDTTNSSALAEESVRSSDYVPQNVLLEFDVFERQGFDNIIRTVAGGDEDVDAYAEEICNVLELVQKLSPAHSTLGYLVYCQLALNRYSNTRFHELTRSFLKVDQLHAIVSDMHEQLLSRHENVNTVHRDFMHDGSRLRLVASLLRQGPSASLFAAEVVTT